MSDVPRMADEVSRRLADAEQLLADLRAGRLDAIPGTQGALLVRPAEDEARADHVRRVLLAVRRVHQALVSEGDPVRLAERVCASLTDSMGYLNAWVALLDDQTDTVTATAASGFDGGFARLASGLAAGRFTRCMTRAIEADRPVVVASPKDDCPDCPLSAEYGGRAGLVVRLRHAGTTHGVLAVSVPGAFAYDAEEQALFGELARDLALALHRIAADDRLRASHELLARAERIAHVGSWEWDIGPDCVRWSEELFRISGLDPRSAAPPFAAHAAFYVADDWQRLGDAVARCVADGTPYELDLRVRRPDGSIRRCVARGQPEVDADGRVRRLVGSLQDVTEQQQTAEALRESEARYRVLSEVTMEGILLHRNGVAMDLNASMAGLLGGDRDELINRNLLEFVHPDDLGFVREQMAREYAPPYTIRLVRRDGVTFFAELESRNVRQQGDLWRVTAVRDVTARVETERALRESEEKYRSLFDQSVEGIFLHDLDGRLIDVNQAACRQTGYSRDELLRLSVFDLHPDSTDSPNMPREEILRLWREWPPEQRTVIEGEHRGKDGTVIPVEISTGVVQYAGRKHVLAIVQDISARRRSEVAQEKLQAQLVQAQKMESVGRLAGGVAHDFNNMLSVILGYGEMALDQVAPGDPLRASLQEIVNAATRSADITQQLLAFARKQTIAPRVLDLNETVEGILKMIRRLIGEDIDLVWLPETGIRPVLMDPSQVHQILANLCVNARDAIAGVGTITIETDSVTCDEADAAQQVGLVPGDYVRLTVSDNGCGMDRETLDHLFEPFFTTKDAQRGTGLGLATVYGIVKQNQGFIGVSSEAGQGTTFRLYLPVHHAAVREAASADEVTAPPPRARSGETILLVEDEPAILKLTTTTLTRLGYAVIAAPTPGEAIELAARHPGSIDLLVTDVVMPGMNGRELAERLAAVRPGVRCLFTSGYTANVIAHHGVLDDGVAFIQKPFGSGALALAVRGALDEPPGGRPSPVQRPEHDHRGNAA